MTAERQTDPVDPRGLLGLMDIFSYLEEAVLSAVRDAGSGANLTRDQVRILLLLSEDDGLTMRELAEQAGVSAPTGTRLVDALAEADFVERREDPSDGRKTLVHLSPAGREWIDQIVTTVPDAVAQTYSQLDEIRRARLRTFRHLLVTALGS